MTDTLTFTRDSDGAPCVKGEDERLITFIETELQESVTISKDLLAMLQDDSDSEFHGNAHSVLIRKETATIEANFDDEAPDRRLDREELSALVTRWITFIS